jgi:hypothetical protein
MVFFKLADLAVDNAFVALPIVAADFRLAMTFFVVLTFFGAFPEAFLILVFFFLIAFC